MKLAFLLNNLKGGGAERVVVTLSNAIAALGHDVAIILVRRTGPFLEDVSPGVRVIELKGGRMLLALPSLVATLRQEGFDVVTAGLDQPNIALMLTRPFVPRRTGYILTEHSHPLLSDAGVSGPIWRAIRLLRKPLYPFADRIIALNHAVREVLVTAFNCFPERIEILPNPVSGEVINAKARAEPPHPWLQENNGPTIITGGRLVPAKDYGTLLRAFALLPATNGRLIIFGEGPERGRLADLVAELGLGDRVALPGFTPHLHAAMKAADLFVLSSRWEGLPTVLIESLAVGTPVVSTDVPSGPRELLGNGEFGLLVPPQNPEHLAKAIADALEMPWDRVALKKRAANYETWVIAERYLALFRQVRKAN